MRTNHTHTLTGTEFVQYNPLSTLIAYIYALDSEWNGNQHYAEEKKNHNTLNHTQENMKREKKNWTENLK